MTQYPLDAAADQVVHWLMEESDLETFETDFILPDRGTAYVSVDSEMEEGKQRFDRLYGELIRDRHRG